MRVPVCVVENLYDIYVGEDQVIRCTEDKLPDIIKVRLAMVKAGPQSDIWQILNVSASHIFNPICVEEHMRNVGWRASEHYYCLILSRKEMNELEGERIHLRGNTFGWSDYRGSFK